MYFLKYWYFVESHSCFEYFVAGLIKEEADKTSILLANEKGACPDSKEYGVNERFSNKIAIAPTASISIICGGASPGIEPIAANSFTQKTLSGSFIVKNPHLTSLLSEKGKDNNTNNKIINRGSERSSNKRNILDSSKCMQY